MIYIIFGFSIFVYNFQAENVGYDMWTVKTMLFTRIRLIHSIHSTETYKTHIENVERSNCSVIYFKMNNIRVCKESRLTFNVVYTNTSSAYTDIQCNSLEKHNKVIVSRTACIHQEKKHCFCFGVVFIFNDNLCLNK